MMRTISKMTLVVGIAMAISSCGEADPTEVEASSPKSLDERINESPDNIDLLLERANNLFSDYEFDKAMNDAAKAFRLDSTNNQARLIYAEVLNNRQKRTVEDVAIAQRHYNFVVQKEPKNLRALVGLASTFSFQQDFEKAFHFINEALRIDPKYRDAYIMKGTTYRLIGNMERAKSSYITATQQDPEFFEAYFLLGQIYAVENDPVCIDYFMTAQELRPDIAEVNYQVAYSKQQFERYEEAITDYRTLAQDTSDFYSARGLFHIAYIKQFYMSDIDSAMYYYKSALKSEPRYVEAWHNLGLCYDEQGDLTRALEAFGKALKYNPEFELSRKEAERLKNEI